MRKRILRTCAALALVATSMLAVGVPTVLADSPRDEDCGTVYPNGFLLENSEGTWQCVDPFPTVTDHGYWIFLSKVNAYRQARGFTFLGNGIACVYNQALVQSDYFGAVTNLGFTRVHDQSRPSSSCQNVLNQPAGEMRLKIDILKSGVTCRSSGYLYNGSTTEWMWSELDMGLVPDCGTGDYNVRGTGQVWQGGAWRGGSFLTSTIHMQ